MIILGGNKNLFLACYTTISPSWPHQSRGLMMSDPPCVRFTPRALTWRPTWEHTLGRSPTSAGGRTVAGSSVGLTSWLGTSGNTPGTNLSSVISVSRLSPGQTTWLFIWGDTDLTLTSLWVKLKHYYVFQLPTLLQLKSFNQNKSYSYRVLYLLFPQWHFEGYILC